MAASRIRQTLPLHSGIIALVIGLLVGMGLPHQATACAPPSFPVQQPDTLTSEDTTSTTDWYALPFVYYTPETSVGAGLAGAYFFGNDPARISSITSDLSATLNGEYEFSFDTELYLNDGQYRLWTSANAARTPASFFGIGPGTTSNARESYTRQMIDLQLRGARRMTHALHAGLRTRIRHATITTVADNGLLDTDSVSGAGGSTVWGIGPMLLVDARSRTYYPQHGHYLSLYALFHPYVQRAQGAFTRLVADIRQFVPLGNDHVLALQGYAEAVTGEPPFALLPSLGGSARMRGYRHARFRDKVTTTLQAEWRAPVWGPIKTAVFGSIGAIAPQFSTLGHTDWKPAAGLGLRYRLTDSGVHLRADFAISPDGTGLYLTGSQPF